jgi:hypothetical protein
MAQSSSKDFAGKHEEHADCFTLFTIIIVQKRVRLTLQFLFDRRDVPMLDLITFGVGKDSLIVDNTWR